MSESSDWLQDELRRDCPAISFEERAEIRFVEVDGGSHRVLSTPGQGRPVVFVPGWGATLEGWSDLTDRLVGRVPLTVIETLEKGTTPIDRSWPDRSVLQMARNVQTTVHALGLQDYVLVGVCWGGAVLLEGCIAGLFEDAPTLVTYDPMHAMWFSPMFIRLVAPLLPVGLIDAIRGPLSAFALRKMDQPVQRARAEAFVAAADAWRWKTFARAAADFELFGRLSAVQREVLVFNGSSDLIHDAAHYPRIAAELPRGRFFRTPVAESDRERLGGVLCAALSAGSRQEPVIAPLAGYEQPLSR
jgi:pimeloyl-ACP methyl ester carboxylesterase